MATENFEKTESKADIMTLEYCYAPEYMPIAKAALAKVHGFQWKNDDVVVATFPRSGTHFVWILTRMLVQGSADPILDAMEDSHVWLPGFTDSQTGRRVLNTHFYIPDVDDSIFKEGNRKFIYVCRNCKDVSVSQFNIYKKFRVFTETMAPHNWEEYLPKCYNFIPENFSLHGVPELIRGFRGNNAAVANRSTETQSSEKLAPPMVSRCRWVNHVRGWDNYIASNPDAPIIFLHFEDIVRNLEENIRKIAAFLSCPLSDKLLEEIIVACQFDNMKNAPFSKHMSKLFTKGKEQSFYRKGQAGDWKNWYTVAQNEFADEFLARDMKGSSIVPIYE